MAADFSRSLLRMALAQICQSLGWNAVQSSPMEILTDVLERYMVEMGKYAHRYSEQFGRTEPNLDDLGLAFHEMGVDIQELMDYVQHVDPMPFALDVPRYPVKKPNQLNFPKPKSRELQEREEHVHDHFPTMHPGWDEVVKETHNSLADEQQAESHTEFYAGDKRPLNTSMEEGSPSKKLRILPEEAAPSSYEMKGVTMSNTGSIVGEGKLPDAKCPPPPTPTTPMISKPSLFKTPSSSSLGSEVLREDDSILESSSDFMINRSGNDYIPGLSPGKSHLPFDYRAKSGRGRKFKLKQFILSPKPWTPGRSRGRPPGRPPGTVRPKFKSPGRSPGRPPKSPAVLSSVNLPAPRSPAIGSPQSPLPRSPGRPPGKSLGRSPNSPGRPPGRPPKSPGALIGRPPKSPGQIGRPPKSPGYISSRPPKSPGQIGRPPKSPGQIGRPPKSPGQIGRPPKSPGQLPLGRPPKSPGLIGRPPKSPGQIGRPPKSKSPGRPPGSPGRGRPPKSPGVLGRPPKSPGMFGRSPKSPGRPPLKKSPGRPPKSPGRGRPRKDSTHTPQSSLQEYLLTGEPPIGEKVPTKAQLKSPPPGPFTPPFMQQYDFASPSGVKTETVSEVTTIIDKNLTPYLPMPEDHAYRIARDGQKHAKRGRPVGSLGKKKRQEIEKELLNTAIELSLESAEKEKEAFSNNEPDTALSEVEDDFKNIKDDTDTEDKDSGRLTPDWIKQRHDEVQQELLQKEIEDQKERDFQKEMKEETKKEKERKDEAKREREKEKKEEIKKEKERKEEIKKDREKKEESKREKEKKEEIKKEREREKKEDLKKEREIERKEDSRKEKEKDRKDELERKEDTRKEREKERIEETTKEREKKEAQIKETDMYTYIDTDEPPKLSPIIPLPSENVSPIKLLKDKPDKEKEKGFKIKKKDKKKDKHSKSVLSLLESELESEKDSSKSDKKSKKEKKLLRKKLKEKLFAIDSSPCSSPDVKDTYTKSILSTTEKTEITIKEAAYSKFEFPSLSDTPKPQKELTIQPMRIAFGSGNEKTKFTIKMTEDSDKSDKEHKKKKKKKDKEKEKEEKKEKSKEKKKKDKKEKKEEKDVKEVPKLTFKFGGGKFSVKDTPRDSPKSEAEIKTSKTDQSENTSLPSFSSREPSLSPTRSIPVALKPSSPVRFSPVRFTPSPESPSVPKTPSLGIASPFHSGSSSPVNIRSSIDDYNPPPDSPPPRTPLPPPTPTPASSRSRSRSRSESPPPPGKPTNLPEDDLPPPPPSSAAAAVAETGAKGGKKGGGGVFAETQGTIINENGDIIWICPGCKMPDDGSPMIGCDVCDDWYHWPCVNITEEPPEDESWFCPKHEKQTPPKKTAAVVTPVRRGRGRGRGKKKKT